LVTVQEKKVATQMAETAKRQTVEREAVRAALEPGATRAASDCQRDPVGFTRAVITAP
jgi:hypothetical protein